MYPAMRLVTVGVDRRRENLRLGVAVEGRSILPTVHSGARQQHREPRTATRSTTRLAPVRRARPANIR